MAKREIPKKLPADNATAENMDSVSPIKDTGMSDNMMSPTNIDNHIDNQVDDELKDMLFA